MKKHKLHLDEASKPLGKTKEGVTITISPEAYEWLYGEKWKPSKNNGNLNGNTQPKQQTIKKSTQSTAVQQTPPVQRATTETRPTEVCQCGIIMRRTGTHVEINPPCPVHPQPLSVTVDDSPPLKQDPSWQENPRQRIIDALHETNCVDLCLCEDVVEAFITRTIAVERQRFLKIIGEDDHVDDKLHSDHVDYVDFGELQNVVDARNELRAELRDHLSGEEKHG